MKLIVGLGNPGRDYEGSRHNIGFEVVRGLAARGNAGRVKNKFQSELVECELSGTSVMLLCPLTYMNLSGKAVRQAVDFYRLPISDLLVICDDMALDLGRIRIRAKGSSGGQKGLENIIQSLGTDEVSRLRIGIGRPPGNRAATEFVLQRFSKSESVEMDFSTQVAADVVEMWVKQGVQAAMNRYNAVGNNEQS